MEGFTRLALAASAAAEMVVAVGCNEAPRSQEEALAEAVSIVQYEKTRVAINLGLDVDSGHHIGEAHVDKSGATFAIACEADTDLSRAYQVAFDDAIRAVEKAVGRTLEPGELRRDAREHFTDGGEGVACSRVSAGPFHVESNGIYPANPAMAPVRGHGKIPPDVGDSPDDQEEHFTYDDADGILGKPARAEPRDPVMRPLYDAVPYNPRRAGGINGSGANWQR